jgi:hypothetical protein
MTIVTIGHTYCKNDLMTYIRSYFQIVVVNHKMWYDRLFAIFCPAALAEAWFEPSIYGCWDKCSTTVLPMLSNDKIATKQKLVH